MENGKTISAMDKEKWNGEEQSQSKRIRSKSVTFRVHQEESYEGEWVDGIQVCHEILLLHFELLIFAHL